MRKVRTSYGYLLTDYAQVVSLTGNLAITSAGYSYQKISACINGRLLSSGGRVWSEIPLTEAAWKSKVHAALNTKRNQPRVTEKEIVERLLGRPLEIVPGSYFGTHKNAKFRCHVNKAHQWETTPAHVLGGQGCPICAGNRALSVAEVAARGLEVGWLLDAQSYRGLKFAASWFCLKHDIAFKKQPEKIIYRNSGCKKCGGERISAARTRNPEEIRKILRSRSIDFKYPESYVGARQITEFVCLKNSQHKPWKTCASHLISDTDPTACPTCSGKSPITEDEINGRIRKKGVELVPGTFRGGLQSTATFRCLARLGHKEWKSIVNNIFAKHIDAGCPACASRGFNPSVSGVFYIIKLHSSTHGQVFGFGISNQWERRWKTHVKNLSLNAVSWEEPMLFNFESGYTCQKLESATKRFLKDTANDVNLNVEGFTTEAGKMPAYQVILQMVDSFSFSGEIKFHE